MKLTIKYGDSTLTVNGTIKDASRAKGMGLNILAEGPSILEIAKHFDANDVPDMGLLGFQPYFPIQAVSLR